MRNDTVVVLTELTDEQLDFVAAGQNNAGGNGINVIVQDIIDDVNIDVDVRGNNIAVAVLSAVGQRQ